MAGKGLSFLHKKTWHVQRFDNIEKKWLAEQKQAEEVHKVELLRKEREEDRQLEELRALQEQATGKKSAPRLDWLYEVPKTSQAEHLLGKPVESTVEESDVKQVAAVPGSAFLRKGATSANERFALINQDPLVAIKRQEQAALQAVLSNPVKMRQIRQQAAARADGAAPPPHRPPSGAGAGSASDTSSDSSSDASDTASGSAERRARKKARRRERHAEKKASKRERKARRAGRAERGDDAADREAAERHDDGGGGGAQRESRRGKRSSRSSGGRDKAGGVDKDRHRDRKRHRHTDRHADERADERAERHDADGGAALPLPPPPPPPPPPGARAAGTPPPTFAPGMGTSALIGGYGLNHTRAPELVGHDRASANAQDALATHRVALAQLHAARAASLAAGPAGVAGGGVGAAHRRVGAPPRALSAEEKERRRREMLTAADEHESQRVARIARQARDAASAAAADVRGCLRTGEPAEGAGHGGRAQPAFLEAVRRDAMGADGGGSASVEEAVRRRQHYMQRSAEVSEGRAFARH